MGGRIEGDMLGWLDSFPLLLLNLLKNLSGAKRIFVANQENEQPPRYCGNRLPKGKIQKNKHIFLEKKNEQQNIVVATTKRRGKA